MINNGIIPGSFRDPSGFIFKKNNIIYRQVNQVYKADYDLLMDSGLYNRLINESLLIPHSEVKINPLKPEISYKIIEPEIVPFISYPYEWSFSQLKDAALTTINIQKIALEFGMSLKDSSSFNIQFYKGKPVFIDTLSFEKYHEGKPWIAYKQFCQHFLSPLTLMSFKDIRLISLFKTYLDGIPLDLTSKLLPAKTYFKNSVLTHIHLHAKSQKRYADINLKTGYARTKKISPLALKGMIDSLETSVKKMNWREYDTEWSEYYEETNYTDEAFQEKRKIICRFLDEINPVSVWDIGANTGEFSREACSKGINTISFDIDPSAVEKNYLESKKNGEDNILPLLLDITNPTPAIGWDNNERMSFVERGPVDAVFALALVHHLAISNNLPLEKIAGFFKKICAWLIIEFVPKSDSQVQLLLGSREDIFNEYSKANFENVFSRFFSIKKSKPINNSERVLYLMENNEN